MAKKTIDKPDTSTAVNNTNTPVADFFKILQKIQSDYPDKKIIVFELGLFATSGEFYQQLKKLTEANQMKNVELLDTSEFINCEECYYSLDFHITPKGHQILADTLVNHIKK